MSAGRGPVLSRDAAAGTFADGYPMPVAESETDLGKRAFRLLARRDRSRAEMQRLLAAYSSDAEIVARLLDTLQSRGWLSEARLAEALVHARRPRASAQRIRQEMVRRGLSQDLIAESTAGLEETDLAAALALWRKRFGEPALDRTQRERQLRFLLNRGFSQAVALKVLRAAGLDDKFEIEE